MGEKSNGNSQHANSGPVEDKTLKLTKLLLTKMTERLNGNVTGGTYGKAELVFMYISSTNKRLPY